ncbi:MAG: hypothetical protein EOP09_06405 [Proteobacteria bacterium]|nr:MAG: hypothetical protein EOP09_06405 [Pseudomonadota bacterium]
MNFKNAIKYAVLTASSVVALSSVNAVHASPSELPADLEKYYTIDSVSTLEVSSESPTHFSARPTASRAIYATPVEGSPIDIGEIIRIGSQIWKIIEKNAPVVDQKFQTVSLVPQGITSWNQLGTWSVPESRVFKKVYTNVYGMNVVEFNYRIAYTPGGSFEGKGKYLSRVEIEAATLNVAWGYKFNATGEIVNPTNAGTASDPIAGTELRMNWQINTPLRHMQSSDRFYVRGDGLFRNLSEGTGTSE